MQVSKADAAPANDNFANRINLGSAATVDTTGDNTDATLEPDEVNPGGYDSSRGYGGNSVWYEWTAPTTGWVRIHTTPNNPDNWLDTVIALFTGSNLATLEMLGHNDESYSEDDDWGISSLSFQAQAGTSYKIAVHGYSWLVDEETEEIDQAFGPFELHIEPAPTPPVRVTSVSWNPNPVNVTTSAQTVTLSLGIVSDVNLFTNGEITGEVVAPGKTIYSSDGISLFIEESELVTGTPTNGVFETTVTIPSHTTPGVWGSKFSLSRDYDGNPSDSFPWSSPGKDLIEDHFLIPSSAIAPLTVVNTGPVDSTGPHIVSISGVPETIDATSGEVAFDVDIVIQDDISGIFNGTLEFELISYSEGFFASFDESNRISGTATSGTYRVPVTVPQSQVTGRYYVTVSMWDESGNYSNFSDHPFPWEETVRPIPPDETVLSTQVAGGPGEPDIWADYDLDNPIDFGEVGVGVASAPQVVEIYNSGSATLTGLALSKTGTAQANLTLGPLSKTSLEPGETATFTVVFTPTVAARRTARINIASNDPDSNPYSIAVEATGVPGPDPILWVFDSNGRSNSDTVPFGTVNLGNSRTKTFEITNAGSANLANLSISKSGTNAADFTLGTLGATVVAPGGTTTFTVTFAPGADGTRTANLRIVSNDPFDNPFDLTLTGTGNGVIEPEITVEQPSGTPLASGDTRSLGTWGVGLTTTRTFTVRNTGTAALSGIVATLSD
ncbi:MAG: choice-of-anchor D domain-containing protein, partial [Verrucomicrobiae bacterium]|nr:choice-of-anchor D domain-containing protein [Verrucomicrobiae bacterium]